MDGVRTQLSPEGKEADKLIKPANPFMLVMVTVELPVVPRLTVIDAGLVDIAKSWTAKATVAEWDVPLLVPITVTV